jgi:hypothetical protein
MKKAWRFYAAIIGTLAIGVGCTHDFDTFDSVTDEGGASADAGSNEAGDACAIATVCTTNAKTCAGNCNQTETQCENNCGGGGGGGHGGGGGAQCKADCADASTTCVGSCVSACTICSACGAEEACKAAAN